MCLSWCPRIPCVCYEGVAASLKRGITRPFCLKLRRSILVREPTTSSASSHQYFLAKVSPYPLICLEGISSPLKEESLASL